MPTNTDCLRTHGQAVFSFGKESRGMSKNTQKESSEKMTITVLGHEVTLYFAVEPNSQVALQVKQVLLGSYLPTKKQHVFR